ncbi:hypothetical protein QC761_0083230 [Podospora bellae-mahoneyi]|uniref:Protein kinase domain-containing protein n=1 Tax=Podospora bellae-mahoneyi TaxID=2093777 RepID=A0ABR0FFV0_9PEZI|nr:hypothetical protein QC761_0083230 [Podospora bellae-mahoneyi]
MSPEGYRFNTHVSALFFDNQTLREHNQLHQPHNPPQSLPTLVESPYLYRSLGFHPILPGDVIVCHLLVLNKLGHGRNNTAWLCLDQNARRRPYKAIRIFHVRASRIHHENTVVFIWQKRDVLGIDDDGRMNGTRSGLVYPVIGPRVDDEGYLRYLAEKSGRSIWKVKKQARYMVADAVESMHGLGLYHGDARPENMLFEVKGLGRLSVGEVGGIYGRCPRGYNTDCRLRGKKLGLEG